MSSDEETYILLLLSDSSLPTGSFVASSGLESYVKHGFPPESKSSEEITISFLQDNLQTYARSTLSFVSNAHRAATKFRENISYNSGEDSGAVDAAIQSAHSEILALDQLYTSMTLNRVAMRASRTQGVALLTLYSKAFIPPTFLSSAPEKTSETLGTMIDKLKLLIRKEETDGNLPVCWGILTAALGLSLERSQFLHLFLHARSILSASVRLNILGPYGAQQLLLYAVRPLITAELTKYRSMRYGNLEASGNYNFTTEGPATTWPLGEILAARHDLLHSRIFNS